MKNKVVVITGASGVLCAELARASALAGAKAALLGRRMEPLEALASEIAEKGGTAKGYSCNVLDKQALTETREAVHRDLGTCDILVNGAGGNHPRATTEDEFFDEQAQGLKDFFHLDDEGIQSVFQLNYLGTVLPVQVFAKDMLGKKGCSIINISSMNAYTPLTKIPAYSGAKAAVSNFTQWLAVYFSRAGIRCNGIAPGFFSTKQNESLLYSQDGTPTERAHKILSGTPMGRFGKPEDLTGTFLYLTDESASGFVTGAVIPVDGGFSAYSGV